MTLRWTIPFVSLNGTSCHVDIYSATGSLQPTVTLKGGAVPFEYEEDTSQNMLEFVRIKTGNINIIEETAEALADILPAHDTDRPVAVYYGSDLIFTGFIQCAEFSNPFVAAPREVSFPVVSPMGLLGSYSFSPSVFAPPALTTIGTLLKAVLTAINPFGYTNVIYPGSTLTPWDCIIRAIAVCPLNDDFKKDYQSDAAALADLYKPQTYLYFIEGLCASLGWMVHDTPSGPVFVEYGDLGNFSSVAVSSLDSPSSRTSITAYQLPFSAFYPNHDNNADYSVQRPLKAITYSTDGERQKEMAMPTNYSRRTGVTYQGEGWMWHLMINYYPGITTISGPLVQSTSWEPTDTSISWSTFWGISTGDISWMYRPMLPITENYNALLKMRLEIGDSFAELESSGWTSDVNGGFKLRVGNMWLKKTTTATDPVYSFVNSETSVAVTFDHDTGRLVTPATIPNEFNDSDGIVIPIQSSGMHGMLDLYMEIGIENPGSKYMRLDVSILQTNVPDSVYKNEIKITGSNSFGVGTENVRANINNMGEANNTNTYAASDGSFIGFGPPAFPYMFGSRRFIRQKVAKGSGDGYHPMPPNPYVPRWYYYGSDVHGRWRVISESFNPRDDEYELILAQSNVLTS